MLCAAKERAMKDGVAASGVPKQRQGESAGKLQESYKANAPAGHAVARASLAAV